MLASGRDAKGLNYPSTYVQQRLFSLQERGRGRRRTILSALVAVGTFPNANAV
jgi:hypothetical protein